MDAPVPLQRAFYRTAYRLLQAGWFLTRPQLQGVKCLLTDEHRVLLVRHTYGRRWWDLPGGGLKRAEAPATAARREMREELGLVLEDWEQVGVVPSVIGHRHDRLHVFRAEVPARSSLAIDLGELSEARWFARAALPPDLAPHVVPILARTVVRRGAPGG